MATEYTDIQIANIALAKLGDTRITSLTENAEAAKKVNAIYATTRDDLLEMHPWPFAKKLAVLSRVIQSEKTITAITAANPPVVTSASHGFSDGDEICITEVVGMTDLNGRTFLVASAAANTFELTDLSGNDIDASEYDAYVSGGIAGEVSAAPPFKYLYRFQLPEDFLRLLKLNNNDLLDIQHEIYDGDDGPELYANDIEINIEYIKQVTDPANFSSGFVELLALKLASDLAYPITRLRTKSVDLYTQFTQKLQALTSTSAQGRGMASQPKQDSWLRGRYTS